MLYFWRWMLYRMLLHVAKEFCPRCGCIRRIAPSDLDYITWGIGEADAG